MIIHWTPCYDNNPISWMQPEPDRLVIQHRGRTTAIDFADSTIVEYELEPPELDYVHRAWRENGVLHLRMPSYGRLSSEKTIDHGIEERISWQR